MTRRTSGFTIIEVTLFLAITGALTAGLLGAVSVSVQRQQYKDAVQSFAGYMRDEYARVVSVENDRDNGAECPVPGSGGGITARGQSNCVIVGRYIVAQNKGVSYSSYPVYASPVATSGSSDWNYSYDDNQSSTYEITWNARTRLASMADDTPFSFVIYRNPDTGRISIQSDTSEYGSSQIGDLIKNTGPDGTQSREVCVYDTGWFTKERQSVYLAEQAGSSNAINVSDASEGCND